LPNVQHLSEFDALSDNQPVIIISMVDTGQLLLKDHWAIAKDCLRLLSSQARFENTVANHFVNLNNEGIESTILIKLEITLLSSSNGHY
jgi:hypothetical protein